MGILIECVDRYGRRVTLSEERWIEHVLPDHPLLLGREVMIPVVLAAPDVVMRDVDNANRPCYYRRRVLPDQPHLFPKVVVEYASSVDRQAPTGIVITAYPTPRPKRLEDQLWP
jgi:hypothetical protein